MNLNKLHPRTLSPRRSSPTQSHKECQLLCIHIIALDQKTIIIRTSMTDIRIYRLLNIGYCLDPFRGSRKLQHNVQFYIKLLEKWEVVIKRDATKIIDPQSTWPSQTMWQIHASTWTHWGEPMPTSPQPHIHALQLGGAWTGSYSFVKQKYFSIQSSLFLACGWNSTTLLKEQRPEALGFILRWRRKKNASWFNHTACFCKHCEHVCTELMVTVLPFR
jgi:hypothetical protein